MDGRLMPGDELAERGVIALAGPGDQLGVGHVVYRHPEGGYGWGRSWVGRIW